jgi:hypothetical protein
MSRSKDIRDLSDKELLNLYNSLFLFANRRFKWIQHKVPGADLNEIIHQTFVDLLTGQRQSDPSVGLYNVMCQIVRSKVGHLWEKEKKRLSIGTNQEYELPNYLEILVDEFSQAYPHIMRPPEASDRQTFYNELCQKILKTVEGDELLERIVELWIAIPDLKPQDIAQELCITMKDLHGAQKRLRSKVKTLKEVWMNV